MIEILLNNNRELIITKAVNIHRGDSGVGNINFLVPLEINDVETARLKAQLHYVLPNGDAYLVDIEDENIESPYKDNFTRISFPITKEITGISGDIKICLYLSTEEEEDEDIATQDDGDLTDDEPTEEVEAPSISIHSGSAYITVLPNPNHITIIEKEKKNDEPIVSI